MFFNYVFIGSPHHHYIPIASPVYPSDFWLYLWYLNKNNTENHIKLSRSIGKRSL